MVDMDQREHSSTIVDMDPNTKQLAPNPTTRSILPNAAHFYPKISLKRASNAIDK